MTSLFNKSLKDPVGPDLPLDAKVLAKFPLEIIRRIYPAEPYTDMINHLNNIRPSWFGFEWTHSCNSEGRIWFQLAGLEDKCTICDDGYFYHGDHEYECKNCDGIGMVFDDPIAEAQMSFDGQLIQIIDYGGA